MDDITTLSHLEALAQGLGLQIRYENLEGENAFAGGGLCRIRGKPVIIVNQRVNTHEKVKTLAKVLKRFDLSQIYLIPALRDFLEGLEIEDN